jgi:glycosyltransferase involved in cell wall biosynthesis
MTDVAQFEVSVVIPAYNAARFVGETIEHVLAQTQSGVEVIVVDDGSRDDTAEVASRYPGVRVLRKPNGGVSSARNHGARAAQARWVAFVDSDDLWHPQVLEGMLKLARRYPEHMMVVANLVLDQRDPLRQPMPMPDGLPPHRLITDFTEVFAFPYLGMSAVLVRKDRFLAVSFNEGLRRAEDVDFFLRLLHGTPGHVRLTTPGVCVRTVEGSLSSDGTAGYVQLLSVYEAFTRAHPEFAQAHPALVNRARADLLERYGASLYREGEMSQARARLWEAIRLHATASAWRLWGRTWVPVSLLQTARRLLRG